MRRSRARGARRAHGDHADEGAGEQGRRRARAPSRCSSTPRRLANAHRRPPNPVGTGLRAPDDQPLARRASLRLGCVHGAIHTCYRITDPERSIAFYEALGLEKRRELPIRDEAVNYFLGVPGTDQPELELTYNFGVGRTSLGTGYGHSRSTIDDMEATLAALAEKGIEPERAPYTVREGGSLLCFVRDPDGYRIELIERSDYLDHVQAARPRSVSLHRGLAPLRTTSTRPSAIASSQTESRGQCVCQTSSVSA